MNTKNVELYLEAIKSERKILNKTIKYIPFALWRIRILKRVLLLDAEIEAKREYLKTVKLHR